MGKVRRTLDALADGRPIDAASLVFFRVAFGVAMAANALRYEWRGWVEDLYIAPTVRFPYWGFEWLPVGGATAMHLAFALVAVSALALAAGVAYRWSVAVFGVSFLYLELIDRTNYLNHYYLVTLFALLLWCMPLGRGVRQVPRWCLYAVRLQLSLVYFFAGIAKLRTDWLAGAPLDIWLTRHIDLPLVGGLMDERWLALAFSWAGALFDLLVAPGLWWKRTRPFAYALVISFHLVTAALFPIGVFPWLMIVATTVFFAPDWPRRLGAKLRRRPDARQAGMGAEFKAAPAVLGVFFLLQLLLPLRHWAYAGRSEWHEQGYRFSWNVMVMEKVGVVEFHVVDREGTTVVHPREELTPFQMRMLPTQPDMILSYAHHLAERWRRDGRGEAQVFAHAWVSLNGRRRAQLIDSRVDLAQEEEGFHNKTWILPFPNTQ